MVVLLGVLLLGAVEGEVKMHLKCMLGVWSEEEAGETFSILLWNFVILASIPFPFPFFVRLLFFDRKNLVKACQRNGKTWTSWSWPWSTKFGLGHCFCAWGLASPGVGKFVMIEVGEEGTSIVSMVAVGVSDSMILLIEVGSGVGCEVVVDGECLRCWWRLCWR